MGKKQSKQGQEPISLLRLVTLGATSSVLVVGGLFMLFAAYESQAWLFWTAEERLSPDKLFGVARNAVTLAAALGVGVTLFFSYRKQQTVEKAQELAVKAQNMALESQGLATETLQLSLEKHELERISELRNRYARSAEQLASDKDAIQMAGIHSLASLADDWARIGNEDDRQVCVSLLCSYVSASSSSAVPEGAPKNTAAQVIFGRLRAEINETPKSWSASTLELVGAPLVSVSKPTFTGGRHSFTRCHWRPTSTQPLTLLGGFLRIQGDLPDQTFPRAIAGDFQGGRAFLSVRGGAADKLRFYRSKFAGSRVIIRVDSDSDRFGIHFLNAEFISGTTRFAHEDKVPRVIFQSCVFTSKHIFVLDGTFTSLNFRFLSCKFSDEDGERDYDVEDFLMHAKSARGARPTEESPNQTKLF